MWKLSLREVMTFPRIVELEGGGVRRLEYRSA